MRSQSIAALTAKANGDDVGYMVALGCPRDNAIRAVAHGQVQRELPNADPDMLYRVGEQRARIMGATETRTGTSIADSIHGNNPNLPSESYLRARAAEIGREIANEKRDDPEDDEDDNVVCPKCGHTFPPED
jgi:hypothetical protein